MSNATATGAPHEEQEHGHAHEQPESTLVVRIVTLATVIIPFAGLVAAITLLWGGAFNWVHLVVFVAMYALTVLGVTIGYHRLFTHRSFKTPRTVAAILAALGSMAAEGSVLRWAAVHRRHHQHSDEEHDPHSPHTHGAGFSGFMRGLWHSHVGWLFLPHPGVASYVKDLRCDPVVRWMSRLFPLWVVVGLLVPAILGGLLTGTWSGVLLGFLWGGLVRILVVHHLTWSINSVCHIWGSRAFRCSDESRNNILFGILGFGEGWHNNHHAFPSSARHGMRWWQLDVSYLIIRGMKLVGLAHDIRVPDPARVAAKRIDRTVSSAP